MIKPQVELTPYLIDAISCYATFIAMGYDPKDMQIVIAKDKIVFFFRFGDDDQYAFVAAELPAGVAARQVNKNWRPAIELWNSLSKAETNLMVASSRALEIVPPFLEFLSRKGHLPALGHDGSSNAEFVVPCPYCQAELICRYDPLRPVVKHPKPPCPDFLQAGGNGVLEEINRRGKFRMLGGTGERPKQPSEPS